MPSHDEGAAPAPENREVIALDVLVALALVAVFAAGVWVGRLTRRRG